MTLPIGILLALLVVTMVLFTTEWLPVDVVTLLLLVALNLTGILTPKEAFSGFANEIIFILGSIFVLSGALVRTGVMDWLAHALFRLGGASESRLVLALTTLSASMSAFLNNTNTTAVLLPATFDLSRRAGVSPSRLLMPLAFASILGGTCTLVGTSTNVAASGLLGELGLAPFTLFEFTPVGLTVAAAGIAYMALIGYRFLPDRVAPTLDEKYAIEDYLSALRVPADSSLVGKTVSQASLGDIGLTLVAIKRRRRKVFPHTGTLLRAADVLIVYASRDALVAAKESPELHLEADSSISSKGLQADVKLFEAFVMPSSVLVSRTVRELDFRQRYGLSMLAMFRRGEQRTAHIDELTLEVGDVLLLQGEGERFVALQESHDLWLLGDVPHLPYRKRKGYIALGALVGAFFLGSSPFMPLSVAMLLGALTVVLTGCLSAQEVYGYIEWRLLVLIAGMTSVGVAMQKTAAAELLASVIIGAAQPLGLYFVMLTFAVLTMVLTQPLSNAAAALVVLPVAVATATQLGVNPRTFAVLVTLSASLSFITPFEPACLLVYGPGGYRFRDFVAQGLVLTGIALAILMVLVPWFWPL